MQCTPYLVNVFRLGFLFASAIWAPRTSASISELQGIWLQPCSENFKRTEVISGSQAQLIESSFLDASCLSPQTTIINTGSVFIGNPVLTPPGATQIDFTFEKVELILQTREAVDFYNSHSICGFEDWAPSKAKDITGLECDLFGNDNPITIPENGEKRFGIYQVQKIAEEERLYFGKLTPTENAKFEETRPTSLDARFYTKQNKEK